MLQWITKRPCHIKFLTTVTRATIRASTSASDKVKAMHAKTRDCRFSNRKMNISKKYLCLHNLIQIYSNKHTDIIFSTHWHSCFLCSVAEFRISNFHLKCAKWMTNSITSDILIIIGVLITIISLCTKNKSSNWCNIDKIILKSHVSMWNAIYVSLNLNITKLHSIASPNRKW